MSLTYLKRNDSHGIAMLGDLYAVYDVRSSPPKLDTTHIRLEQATRRWTVLSRVAQAEAPAPAAPQRLKHYQQLWSDGVIYVRHHHEGLFAVARKGTRSRYPRTADTLDGAIIIARRMSKAARAADPALEAKWHEPMLPAASALPGKKAVRGRPKSTAPKVFSFTDSICVHASGLIQVWQAMADRLSHGIEQGDFYLAQFDRALLTSDGKAVKVYPSLHSAQQAANGILNQARGDDPGSIYPESSPNRFRITSAYEVHFDPPTDEDARHDTIQRFLVFNTRTAAYLMRSSRPNTNKVSGEDLRSHSNTLTPLSRKDRETMRRMGRMDFGWSEEPQRWKTMKGAIDKALELHRTYYPNEPETYHD